MQFIVSSNQLLRQLQTLSGVLSNSNTLPILDHFLFELAPGELVMTASDLETTMSSKMEVRTDDTGAIAVPARMLLDILKAFPDIPLTLKVDASTHAVELTSDAGKYKLTGANADEFPQAPALEGASGVDMGASTLVSAINRTLFAAGSDDLRPVMSGIFFELYADNVRFVATDAHRLVRYARTDASAPETSSFIVPKKPLNLLKNAASAAESVNISYTESNACFTFDDVTIMCRLIEGKYPNYEAVIPKDNPNRMTINRSSAAIRRAAIFANKTTHQVRLRIAGSELTVSAEDLDFANEATEHWPAVTMERTSILFQQQVLVDLLNNLSAEEVNLELRRPIGLASFVQMSQKNQGRMC